MKKAFLLLFLITLVSCSEKSDPQPLKAQVTAETITGTWIVESIEYTECANSDDYSIPTKCPDNCRKYIFVSGGSFSWQYSEGGDVLSTRSGDYSITDNELTLADWSVYTVTIKDSVMTWTEFDEGCKITVTLVR